MRRSALGVLSPTPIALSVSATYGDGVYLVQGCGGLINSWSSGLYDSERQRMVVWGGGHNDYGGNELYAFNLKTLAWEQLTTPSRPTFQPS